MCVGVRNRSETLRLSNNQLLGTVPAQLTTTFPVMSMTWSGNCIVNATATLAGCDLAERSALLDFYTATHGGGWVVSTGWMTSAHPCSWYGVTCQAGSTIAGPVV